MVRLCMFICFLSPLGFAQDITLDYAGLLERLDTSPRIVLATQALELAEAQVQVAGSLLTGELSAGYSRTWSNAESLEGFDDPSGGNVDPIALTTSLNIVPYGPRYDGLERTRAERLRAQASLQDTKNDVLLNATRQFQEALLAQERVALQAASLALAQARLEEVSVRLEGGAANETERLQTELARSQSEADLAAAERATLQALGSLSVTLGQTVTAVTGGVPYGGLPELLATQGLERRSDVLAARLDLAEARRSANATLRDNLPGGRLSASFQTATPSQALTIGGSYSTTTFQPALSLSYDPDTGARGLDTGSAQSFTLSVGLSVPLDTALPAALRAAELLIQQRQAQLEQTLALAQLDIDTAFADLDAAESALNLATELLNQREQAREVAQTRFDLGLTSQLELHQAELELARASLDQLSASNNLGLAQLTLLAALNLNIQEVF